MSHFMGTFQAKLDSKGRVFIPAAFRAVLRGGADEGDLQAIVMLPHFYDDCVQAMTQEQYDATCAVVEEMPKINRDRDDMIYALYSHATKVAPDRDGRIVLPESVAMLAGITDQFTFVGARERFEIWEPEAFAARYRLARARNNALGQAPRSAA